jgi:hypothetical protein
LVTPPTSTVEDGGLYDFELFRPVFSRIGDKISNFIVEDIDTFCKEDAVTFVAELLA